MKTSILIVSKNRKQELDKTLSIIIDSFNFEENEILVFLDNCNDNSIELKIKYDKIKWFTSDKDLGASLARRNLYKQAKGQYFIGFDDDAHPLQKNFIQLVINKFVENQNVAILAFQEVRGQILDSDIALLQDAEIKNEFFTSDFVGCGFAIKKDKYFETTGFPEWIDIYGEEACVAIQILDLGFDILFTNQIKVNHRVNKKERILQGKNYFRFAKQLKNETFFYLVYFPNPFIKIFKLYWHNFKKYALIDSKFFFIFFHTIYKVLINLFYVLKFRKPVNKSTIIKRKNLNYWYEN